MANLVELFDNIVQMQNLNGVPLAAGKLYVYALGRTRLMDTWSDVDGESLNPNPIILDDAGQAHVYVSDDFDYTLVVCDQYNNEIFSLDKYLYSKGSHSHADVAVAPSESIAVSSYHVGECTVYVPYLTGQLGKVYEGIDPIVVNNQVDKISANHVPIGVQDPLYFVQDDEEGCIIGFSGEVPVPAGTMNESAFGYQDGQITGYNGSAFSAGNTYEAGSYVDIDGNTINITGLQPAGNYQSAGDYVVHDELSSYATEDWVENQSYMKEYMESAFYPATSNPSGYLTAHQDISNKLDTTAFSTVSGDFLTAVPSEYVTENTLQSGLSSKLDSTAFSTVSSNFLTAVPEGYATTSQLSDVSGDITALIPSTAGLASETYVNEQTSGKLNKSEISFYNDGHTTYATAISGKEIYAELTNFAKYDINGNSLTDKAAKKDLTATSAAITAMIPTDYYPNTNPSGFITGVDLSNYATTSDLQTVSGEITAMIPTALTGDYLDKASADTLYYGIDNPSGFITGVPADMATTGDIADMAQSISETYQPIGNYQTAGNYYSASNPSGFITGVDLTPYQTTAGMTAYQSAGDYLTTADSAEFYTTANESGFITGVDLTPYQLTADMTAYQPAGDYLTTGDSANFYTTANESGFITGVDLSPYQTTAGMTAYANSAGVTGTAQYGLTTAGWTEISAAGGGVSGTNVVFEPSYEGSPYGNFYSATVSGDVSVTTGQYDNNGAEVFPMDSYSLSSIGANLGNKLDKNKIEDSNTIAIIDNHAEVTGRAYRPTEFSDISAYHVDVRLNNLNVDFLSENAGLYSAIVIVETTASGESIPDDWSLVSYENNSATFTRYYPLNKDYDTFYLYADEGWGDFTNAEASAAVYSALEIAPLAFKDEIVGITYTTGSI